MAASSPPKIHPLVFKAFLERQRVMQEEKEMKILGALTAREKAEQYELTLLKKRAGGDRRVTLGAVEQFYERNVSWKRTELERRRRLHEEQEEREVRSHPFYPLIPTHAVGSSSSSGRRGKVVHEGDDTLITLAPLEPPPGAVRPPAVTASRPPSPLSSEVRPRTNSAVAAGIDKAEAALGVALKMADTTKREIAAAQKELARLAAGRRCRLRREALARKGEHKKGVEYWEGLLAGKMAEEGEEELEAGKKGGGVINTHPILTNDNANPVWEVSPAKESPGKAPPQHEAIQSLSPPPALRPPHHFGSAVKVGFYPKYSLVSCTPTDF